MAHPEFDPTVFEAAELAEINRPYHDAFWTFQDVQDGYRAGTVSTDDYLAARAVFDAALAKVDQDVAAYAERAEAREADAAEQEAADAVAAEPTFTF